MKKTIKNILLIMFLFLSLSFNLNKVMGVSSAVYTGEGSIAGSVSCGSSNCTNTNPDYYGIKVTIMVKNKSDNLIKYGNAFNKELNGNSEFYLVNSNYKNKSTTSIKNDNSVKEVDFLPSNLSSAENFQNFLSSYSLKNQGNLKKILKAINSNLITGSGDNLEFNSSYDFSNYYLKIEPVLALAFRRNTTSEGGTGEWRYAYTFGTPSEIAIEIYSRDEKFYTHGGMKHYSSDISDVARSFIVTAGQKNSKYCSYYEGTTLKTFTYYDGSVNSKINTACGFMNSQWNVLKNYFTSLQINTTKISPYTKSVDEEKHSAYAFAQINDKSIYGKTLVRLSDFVPTCKSEFDASDKSIQTRYNIFVKYGKIFNNLFNFNADTGELACQRKSCKASECRVDDWQKKYATCNNESNSCLNYNYESTEEDYSCYSELKLNDDQKTINYICNTDFKFENKLGATSFNVWPGLRITGTDGLIGTARVFKRCYVNSGTPRLLLKYSDNKLNKYVSSIKFNGESLKATLSTISRKSDKGEEPTIVYKTKNNEIDSNYVLYDGAKELNNVMIKTDYGHEYVIFDYNVYASNQNLEKGTGAKEETKKEKFSYETARGIFTSYKWRKTSSGEIPFQIEFTNKGKKAHFTDYDSTKDSNKCTYNVSETGLFSICNKFSCNNDLNIEFRIIDTKNPFTKMGSNDSRNTMTNWCDKTAKDNQCLPTNNIVKKYITNKPNSYGFVNNKKISGSKIKYKITLTPQLMDDIKKTAKSKNITYDRFNLTCENKKCTSELLTYLNNNSTLTINGSTKR